MGSWGSQFSTGDQSKSIKEIFSNSGYSVCPQCNKSNISEDKQCAGCRHNGDGYGTCVFSCNDCGWTTSFQYDEADTPYFYETRFFGKSAPKPEPKREPELTESKKKKYVQLIKLGAPDDAIAQTMRLDGFFEEKTIQKFIKDNRA